MHQAMAASWPMMCKQMSKKLLLLGFMTCSLTDAWHWPTFDRQAKACDTAAWICCASHLCGDKSYSVRVQQMKFEVLNAFDIKIVYALKCALGSGTLFPLHSIRVESCNKLIAVSKPFAETCRTLSSKAQQSYRTQSVTRWQNPTVSFWCSTRLNYKAATAGKEAGRKQTGSTWERIWHELEARNLHGCLQQGYAGETASVIMISY